MDLVRCLGKEKQAATDENDVSPRDVLSQDSKPRLGQAHDPGDRKQQCQASKHRQAKPGAPCKVALVRRQTPDQYGYKYDVVHAEDNLQRRQGAQCDPCFGGSQPLEHVSVSVCVERGQ